VNIKCVHMSVCQNGIILERMTFAKQWLRNPFLMFCVFQRGGLRGHIDSTVVKSMSSTLAI
jgi:hypothetical protein